MLGHSKRGKGILPCELTERVLRCSVPTRQPGFRLFGRLRIGGKRMQGNVVKKLTEDIFELRVKQFARIFRVLFFYQPGMLIVITSGFQKKTEQTPQGEITRAEQLKRLWMKYRNRYTGSQKE